MKIVRITMEGGVIQHIDCPKGVQGDRARLRHRWLSEENLRQDDNGDDYLETLGGLQWRLMKVEQYELHAMTYRVRGHERGRGYRQSPERNRHADGRQLGLHRSG